MHTLTNTAPGPRGVNTKTGYAELAPGETQSVDLDAAELASAKAAGYFDFGKPGAAPPPDNDAKGGPGGSLPSNIAQLRKIARDEGIDVSAAKTVPDTQAAIVAARQAKAAEAGSGSDDLDAMDDETLRNTAAAITGKPVDELAGLDRAALLAMARGE